MKIDFTGRGVEITDQIKAFSESKFERLKRHLSEIHDLTVVLSVEKYRHRAEIKFQAHKRSFHGAEETSDMFQSIDRVVDKLEAQIRKYKEKVNQKKKHTSETIRRNGAVSPTETENQSGPDDAIQVIRTPNTVKPMNLDEAVEELEKLNHNFLIFRNSESQEANVIFRRKDGNIGLVEPGN